MSDDCIYENFFSVFGMGREVTELKQIDKLKIILNEKERERIIHGSNGT